MNVLLIEVLLWACLLLFFWTLKDGLNNAESDLESMRLLRDPLRGPSAQQNLRYTRPQTVAEPIGSYGDEQIYRYAVIEGRTYEFDHVRPAGDMAALGPAERCLEPGLVYLECDRKNREN